MSNYRAKFLSLFLLLIQAFPGQANVFPHPYSNNSRPPEYRILTGNDKASTSYDKAGSLDTTPVDDTGTEKDRPVISPWYEPKVDQPMR